MVEQRRLDKFAEFDQDCDGLLNQSEMAAAAAALYPVSLPACRLVKTCVDQSDFEPFIELLLSCV